MKILYLPLKKEWYEMIERGDKREEYRENTRYWKTRLIDTVIYDEGDEETESPVFIFFKDYDAVCFSYGYTRRRMLWECKGVDFGRGRPEWGAPDHETFIIKLGNRLNDNPADAGIETDFRVGQQVSFTNEYGVRFEPHVIMGFCKPELSGRCVYLDYDCYWFPTELKSLKPYRK